MSTNAEREREPGAEEDEEMPATERELAEDAAWKRIQQNTFTRWANEHLKTVNKHMGNLETDLADGLRLICLIEVLSGKKLPKHNKRPTFRSQKLENVSVALKFLEEDEGIRIVNIDSSDIVGCKLKLILGLIWTLILHYSISMPMWEGEEDIPHRPGESPTPKQRLLGWIQSKIPDLPITNFTSDWNDGRAVGALVDAVAPGLCPDWQDWDPKNAKRNATEALKLAEDWLGVPQLIRPEEMVMPKVDELSMMTYLSQFPAAKLKPGAPLRPRINPNRVRAYGPGIEPNGVSVGAPARFAVETFGAGQGKVEIYVENPKGEKEPVDVKFNNDRNLTYSVSYTPRLEGPHKVKIIFAGKEIPKSPYAVMVEGHAGDATKVTAKGPGLEPTGVMIGKSTYFEVFTKDAGRGQVEVIVLDPQGHKNSVQPVVKQSGDSVWRCDYVAQQAGLHSVNVFFAGRPIPNSPFAVKIAPVSDPKKVRAFGRGLQPKGIRVRDIADFKVFTDGSGEGKLEVKVIGPGGVKEKVETKKTNESTYECIYRPMKEGKYTVIISYGGVEIPRSPFEVQVAKFWDTKIHAYGPGLESGMVGCSADFTVETNGETGALGFSIEGPSQAKIDCKDNGDGSADVKYWPTIPGDYAVHILCNEEDIPHSPYMATIQPKSDCFPDKVKAFGPGLEKTGVTAGKQTEFTVDTRQAGKSNLKITALDEDYNPVNVQIRDNKDGTYTCSYTAIRNIKHSISITYGGVAIANSPFRVYVNGPTSPNKVKVYGPGVEKGVKSGQATHFFVDCKQAGPGEKAKASDIRIALTDEKGKDVPFKITDNGDGTFKIDYTAPTPGTYKVTVFFAGREIPSSPIKVVVTAHLDVSKIKVEGLEPKACVNSQQEVKILTKPSGQQVSQAQLLLISPSGKNVQAPVRPSEDGFVSNFSPTEVGGYKINPTVDNVPIFNQPFKMQCVPGCDATKVKAYGPGLTNAIVNRPTNFTIDTKKAGQGPLSVTIVGPGEDVKSSKEVPVKITDNKDGTYNVDYCAPMPGSYKVNMLYGGRAIPNSPVKVVATSQLDVSKIKVEGLEPKACINSQQEVKILTKESGQQVSQAQVLLTSPKGKSIQAHIQPSDDGFVSNFSPTETGEYKINPTVDNVPIFPQPFKMQSVPGCDPTKVIAYGPGLNNGNVNEATNFTIDTKKAGKGPLKVTIVGPGEDAKSSKEVPFKLTDNKDGTFKVEYSFPISGTYKINILYGGHAIPNSPIKVTATALIDVSKIKVEGLETKVCINSQQEVKILTKESGQQISQAQLLVTSPKGKPIQAPIRPSDDGFVSNFSPTETGEYKINPTVDNVPIFAQPFKMHSMPGCDPTKVKAYGPGLNNGNVNEPTNFTIDTKKAGKGPLKVTIVGPGDDVKKSKEVPIKLTDNKDGTFKVDYNLTLSGTYKINILYGGHAIPNSPVKVVSTSLIDVSKIKVEGLEAKTCVNSQQEVKILTKDSGQQVSQAQVLLTSPKGKSVPATIKPSDDGFVANFTPTETGEYKINPTVDNVPIFPQPFKMQSVPGCDPTKVKAYGPGLSNGKVNEPTNFTIDTKKAGQGPLSVTIVGPGEDVTNCKELPFKIVDNKDGTFKVDYNILFPGTYKINILYGGQAIPNSPINIVSTSHIDVSKIKVEGLEAKACINSQQEVNILTKDSGQKVNQAQVLLTCPSGKIMQAPIRPSDKGFISNFTPTETGEYKINPTVDNVQVFPQPFKMQSVPGCDSTKVKAYGPGLSNGNVNEPTNFTIDTKKAGQGPLSVTIVGPGEDVTNCKELPFKIVDNKDGTFKVDYNISIPGTYKINILYGGQAIPNSPINIVSASRIDVSKIKVEGLEAKACINSQQEVNILSKDSGQQVNQAQVLLTCPSGKIMQAPIRPSDKGFISNFMPTETGEYKINPTVDNVPIFPQPFKMQSVPGCDPTKVKAYGPGLTNGNVNQPTNFTIDTKKAGQGPLSVTIAGPGEDVTNAKEVPFKITDNKDGTFKVDYNAPIPGLYKLNISYGGQDIPNSPINVVATAVIDVSKIKVEGLETKACINSQQEIKILTKESDQQVNQAEVLLTSPSGQTSQAAIQPSDDGFLSNFSPNEIGEYKINPTVNNVPIFAQPCIMQSVPGCDPTKVKAYGPGLTNAIVNQPSNFTIDTKKAGLGPLSMIIVGPGEDATNYKNVPFNITDNGDGTFKVDYNTPLPGTYALNISYAGCEIPNSPFKVVAETGQIDVSKIQVEGLDEKACINSQQEIKILTKQADQQVSQAQVLLISPSGQNIQAPIQPSDDGFISTFLPTEIGEYKINPTVNDVPIFTQPFIMQSVPGCDPTKVKAYGPGLTNGIVNQLSNFTIDTKKAGQGPLSLTIVGPSEDVTNCKDVPFNIIDNGDGTFKVDYNTPIPGTYTLNISYAGCDIPNSPFKVVTETGQIDVSKIKVEGLDDKACINSQQEIKILTKESGQQVNQAQVLVTLPTGQITQAPIQSSEDGFISNFSPIEIGEYKINPTVDNNPILAQPFIMQTVPGCDSTKVKAYGPGLTNGIVNQPTNFTIDTKKAGQGPLTMVIVGPSEDVTNCKDVPFNIIDNGDGTFKVDYNTPIPGTYTLNISYAGCEIPNSPFKVVAEAGQIDVSKIQVEGLDEKACINSQQEVKILTKQSGQQVNQAQVLLTLPSGQITPAPIQPSDDGFVSNFSPSEIGEYKINPIVDNLPIFPQPFIMQSVPGCDPTKVKAYGPGLTTGVVNEQTNFTIDTKKAGQGPLSLTIVGPGEDTANCKDVPYNIINNGDGTFKVDYNTPIPGTYTLNISYAECEIPNSPFKVIAAAQIDVSKIQVEGLDDTACINSQQEVQILTKQSGQQIKQTQVLLTCPSGKVMQAPVRPSDNGFISNFSPTEIGEYKINATVDNVPLFAEPFKMQSVPGCDPTKVKAYGPGLMNANVNEPTSFTIDTKKAGQGPLSMAIVGPGEDVTNCKDVPFKITDNKDGTVKVDYSVPIPGTYKLNILYAGQEIPNSPINIAATSQLDVSKIQVEGLDEKACLNSQVEVKILTKLTGQQIKQAQLFLTSPSGKNLQAPVQPLSDGFITKFSPTEIGEYKINPIVDNIPIFPQPFKMQSVPGCDPSKVKVYGPGLTDGLVNQPADFTIDTKRAGQGPLGLTVEGPCEAIINCKDNGDGTCGVVYQPTAPGDYTINITYASQHVPGSPFKANIKPSVVPGTPVDVSSIKTYGYGVEQGAFLDSTTEFTVDAVSVTKKGEGKVRALITTPSGTKVDALVTNNNNGTYKVNYTPFEEGHHTLEVTYDGIPVPNTPHKVNVVRGCDPSKCRAYGPGLQSGFTSQTAQFTVETKGAGTGGLGLAVEGPSEAKMTCKDNRDGTCSVEYLPTEPGDYDIAIKFADHHIPGSPFRVHVDTPVDASKVVANGPGLEPKNCRANVPVSFKVDTTKAGRAPLGVDIASDKGSILQKPQMKSNNDGTYDVTYFPPVEGAKCTMRVTYGGKDIPKSPFVMNVLPTCEPKKVNVTGPGVNKSGVPASIPVDFIIDTKEAGFGDLEVFVQGPDGDLKKVKVIDQKDGTFKVTYTPDDAGNYNVVIKYGGQEVPNSPFQVKANPTGDATKCKITEGLQQTIVMGEECCVTVNAKQAGKGAVTCRIRSSSGNELDIDLSDNGDGTFSIYYTAKDAGEYTLNIKYGGQSVPGGTYTITATTEEVVRQTITEQYQKTTTSSSTTTTTSTTGGYRPIELRNIPVSTAGGTITGEVKMPSGKTERPTIVDNKDGTVTVKYEPKEIGLHELHVKYNKEHVQGSPFKFHVDNVNSGYVTAYGSGLTHGICGEPCNFIIVTKDAGAGGLALAVEGPSKAEITCQDNKDGTCSVSYLPTAPGEYKIVVKFDDKHINGSPFSAKITGEGRKRSQISVGSSSEVSLKVTETDVKNLNASIKAPSGLEEPCFLKKLPNGHLGISFTPREKGEHLVYVKRQGAQIAGSPFKIMVGESEIGDANKVKVFGQALKDGMTQVLNEFTINTKEAGYGGLSLSVEGPSRADIQCTEAPDGSLNVGYKPTEPGFYIINIKFADHHVPGSPFTARVTGEGTNRQTEKISRKREAVPVTSIGSECELSLKIPGTSPMDMSAHVTSPGGVTHDADICSIADCTYTVKFIPAEMGIHTVSIKHKDLHIPGSPFQFTVGPFKDAGAHKVHAGGPGLERGEVNGPCEFNVWTREAGPGNLSIAVEGPSKAEIDFKDRKDGSCCVSYSVPQHGEYTVSVKFNDQHIPDSPFKVYVTPQLGEARRLEVAALQDSGLTINKPCAFTVVFNGAKGHLDAKVVAPSGAEDDAFLTPIDDDTYAVRFIPHENGIHYVHIRFDGVHIRGSPYRVRVGKEEADPAAVTAYGKGLESAETGTKTEFVVNTCNAGAGTLAVTIDGPSKVAMDCSEVDDGYKVRYTPLAPGDYFITIKYSGFHIVGSPFKVHCLGPVRGGGGLHETSSVVVETVTKTSTQTSVKPIMPKFNSDASKVQSKGIGLKKAYMQKQNMFTVNCQDAGQNILLVGVYGPKHPCEEVFIKHLGRNTFQVNYVVKERGEYLILVKWGEDHIPGSPFQVVV